MVEQERLREASPDGQFLSFWCIYSCSSDLLSPRCSSWLLSSRSKRFGPLSRLQIHTRTPKNMPQIFRNISRPQSDNGLQRSKMCLHSLEMSKRSSEHMGYGNTSLLLGSLWQYVLVPLSPISYPEKLHRIWMQHGKHYYPLRHVDQERSTLKSESV